MRTAAWNRIVGLMGVTALLAPGMFTVAQEVQSLGDILGGKKLALVLKPADLPESYKPVRFKSGGSSGGGGLMDMFSMMMSPVAMILGSSSDMQGATLMGVADLSWTQGDIVKVQGKDFIVTYKWNLDLTQMMAPNADSEQAKTDALKKMELTLTLVAVDSLSGISPVANFTKADLIKVLEMPVKPKEDGLPAETVAVPETAIDVPSSDPAGDTLNRIKELGTAMSMYATDCDDVLPYAQSTKTAQYVVFPYVRSADILKSLNPNSSQFLYNIAVGGSRTQDLSPQETTVLFYESKAWPDGRRAVVFVNGHAAMLTEAEWLTVQGSLKAKFPKVAKPLPANYGADFNPGG